MDDSSPSESPSEPGFTSTDLQFLPTRTLAQLEAEHAERMKEWSYLSSPERRNEIARTIVEEATSGPKPWNGEGDPVTPYQDE